MNLKIGRVLLIIIRNSKEDSTVYYYNFILLWFLYVNQYKSNHHAQCTHTMQCLPNMISNVLISMFISHPSSSFV